MTSASTIRKPKLREKQPSNKKSLRNDVSKRNLGTLRLWMALKPFGSGSKRFPSRGARWRRSTSATNGHAGKSEFWLAKVREGFRIGKTNTNTPHSGSSGGAVVEQPSRAELLTELKGTWGFGTSFRCERRASHVSTKEKPCQLQTHWASIASASVSLTTRTGSLSSSASFAALRRRAPATTSYLLSSSSRTRRGARIPCVLKLAAFCVVGHFVAEGAKHGVEWVVHVSKGHITCDGRDLMYIRCRENPLKL